MLQTFIDIVAAPSAAFARLKTTPTILLPLLLLFIMNAAVTSGYLLINDEGFVKGEIIEQYTQNPNLTREQSQAIEKRIDTLSLSTQAMISVASLAVILPLMLAIYAGYLTFCGKFFPDQLSYKHWYSLSCWITVPIVFSNLASLLVLLTDTNNQVSQQDLQVFGFIRLFNLDIQNRLLEQIGIAQVWSLGLQVIGYKQWTGTGMTNAVLVALIPTVLIYCTVAYFTF